MTYAVNYSGTSKKSVRYNEVSLYQGSFPYILVLLGGRKWFVIPRTSLYRGSLYRGSTVTSDRYIIVCLNPWVGKMSQIST